MESNTKITPKWVERNATYKRDKHGITLVLEIPEGKTYMFTQESKSLCITMAVEYLKRHCVIVDN